MAGAILVLVLVLVPVRVRVHVLGLELGRTDTRPREMVDFGSSIEDDYVHEHAHEDDYVHEHAHEDDHVHEDQDDRRLTTTLATRGRA